MPTSEKPPALGELPLMTPWYGPKALAQTGLRDFVSRLIGEYADQRILQAAVDTPSRDVLVSRYDYSSVSGTQPDKRIPADADGAVWVDFVADTGDGFNSTYAIASLLAADELKLEGVETPLPGGQLLLMGGDQAYPYASVEQYKSRLIRPFDMTIWDEPDGARPKRKVFILPGNHDWYDGLSAFDQLFCNQRDGISEGQIIGPYQCQQHRSYWAIRLPHDWWIWGLDIQLTASLDVGQMQYFNAIAQCLPKDQSKAKIILCIATPSWLEGAETGSFESYSTNLQRILNLAIGNARLCCVISGDWHHYARYFSDDFRLNLITSGGGGAYLAPTHKLPARIDVPWKTSPHAPLQDISFRLNAPTATDDEAVAPPKTRKERRRDAIYPPRRISRRLSWLIPFFPLWNPTFCLGLGFLYFLMYWFYTSATNIVPFCMDAVPSPDRPFCGATASTSLPVDVIMIQATSPLTPFEHLTYLFQASRWQPALALTLFVVWGLIYQFLAGAKRAVPRIIEATVFWLLHVFLMAYMADLLLSITTTAGPLSSGWRRIGFTSGVMWLVGGGLAGLMCGIYLFLGCRVFNTHADKGFSSIRIEGYKNFLRMKITENELTIYPIGLRKVPGRQRWREPRAGEKSAGVVAAYVSRRPLRPQLIEGPITIRPAEIRDLIDRPLAPATDTKRAAAET